jgi:quercetin dioxygenase-like cupin family protein
MQQRTTRNGSVSVFEVLVPVGQKLTAPAHKNDAYEEILYGIEGRLTWTVDGTPIDVGPGQALCIPRGAQRDLFRLSFG